MTSPADLDADRILPWVLRVLWLALPFTLGTQIGDALEGTSRPVQLTGTVGAMKPAGGGLEALSTPLDAKTEDLQSKLTLSSLVSRDHA